MTIEGLKSSDVIRGYTTQGTLCSLVCDTEPELTLYLAGERVGAGSYRRLDTNMAIRLEREDYLPASLDGHVACYVHLVSLELGITPGFAVAETSRGLPDNNEGHEDRHLP